jgi:Protein of unknown function (DUF2855)
MMAQALWVKKDSLADTQIVDQPDAPLAAGAVRLAIQSFAVTANNVTYAVIGDMFHYWNFFPAADGWGVVPMWGHAVVIQSNCPEIAVGERVYGYLPTATQLDVIPGKISDSGFTDMAQHRQPMSAIYNQYNRLAADPQHNAAHEDARMIFSPLFTTGFLIADFYQRNHWFGAQALIMTSASSKTAMGLAHCAKIAAPDVRRIGLTAAHNVEFVTRSGLYDDVIAYGAVATLPVQPAVSVDFAGNATVLRAIHTRFGDQLRFSSTVGMTHVGARAGEGTPLPGPQPQLFFAPSEALETIKALGQEGFAAAMGAAWRGFLDTAARTVTIAHLNGLPAARDVFLKTLAGQQSPETGIVIRL